MAVFIISVYGNKEKEFMSGQILVFCNRVIAVFRRKKIHDDCSMILIWQTKYSKFKL